MSVKTRVKKLGRPPAKDGPLIDRPIGLSREMNDTVQGLADAENISVPEWVRRLIDEKVNPKVSEIDRALIGTNQFRAPYIASVPCGPWDKSVKEASSFVISSDVADEIEAKDGDVWIRADGQSMEGLAIQDGCLVLVRPYGARTPRRGEIVLIQVTDPSGECVGTLKQFDGIDSATRLPKLLDGEGNPYPLPEKVESVEVIGRAVANLGRL